MLEKRELPIQLELLLSSFHSLYVSWRATPKVSSRFRPFGRSGGSCALGQGHKEWVVGRTKALARAAFAFLSTSASDISILNPMGRYVVSAQDEVDSKVKDVGQTQGRVSKESQCGVSDG